MKNQFVGWHLDFVGFSASLLCAIHCAALPLLLTLAPLAGLQFLENPWIEYGLILVSFLIASNALLYGYRKTHQKPLALIIGVVGFIFIALAQTVAPESMESLLMTFGGISIAIAHLINWRLINQSKPVSDGKLHHEETVLQKG